jgi:peptidoglycan/xylan/chitin deacetylase (PgdA/CDA1 family)
MIAPLVGSMGDFALPGGNRGRFAVLIYHRVLTECDPIRPGDIDVVSFEVQMRILAKHFNVLPAAEAIQRLKNDSLPPRTVCVTFDDGYADNETLALPVLSRYKIPATFFVAAGFINGGRMWNDSVIESIRVADGPELDLRSLGFDKFPLRSIPERCHAITALLGRLKYLPLQERAEKVELIARHVDKALPDDLMMTSAQLNTLVEAGMEIGGHTMNHPILANLDSDSAAREVSEGRALLADVIGAPIRLFAYPNGFPGRDYRSADVDMVQEMGFLGAFSTARGVASTGVDCYQIPRVSPWDRRPFMFALRLLRDCIRPQAPVV